MLNSDLAITPAIVSAPITGYTIGAQSVGLVEVLVDCPAIEGLFTYNIPERLTVRVGDILSKQPLNRRTIDQHFHQSY